MSNYWKKIIIKDKTALFYSTWVREDVFLLSSDICIYEKMKDIASTQIIKINLQILMCERKSLPFSFVANVIFPNMRFCIFVAFLENWIFHSVWKLNKKSHFPNCQNSTKIHLFNERSEFNSWIWVFMGKRAIWVRAEVFEFWRRQKCTKVELRKLKCGSLRSQRCKLRLFVQLSKTVKNSHFLKMQQIYQTSTS